MSITFHDELLSPELLRRLEDVGGEEKFSVRAVLVAEGVGPGWILLGCVVKHEPVAKVKRQSQRFVYPTAILGMEYVYKTDLEKLLTSLSKGDLRLFGESVKVDLSKRSESQRVSVNNYWMKEAGTVFTVRPNSPVNPSASRLLTFGSVFYPDCYEAARHWLGLNEHHGQSDSRKGDFMLLFPETQALIIDWQWHQDLTLDLQIAGPAATDSKLEIAGAYWCGQKIRHFNSPVENGKASVTIEADAERLELYLLGDDSREYDMQRDDLRFPRTDRTFLGTRRSSKATDRVNEALLQGEGPRIEFKEFLELPKRTEPLKDKDKLHQVLRTVAAFANTQGGTLFLGILDECVVVGAMRGIRKLDELEETAEGSSLVERYMGALRTRIRDALYPSVQLSTTAIEVGEHLVIAIDVEPAIRPVSLTREAAVIVRRGSSNVSVQPADWKPRDSFLSN